MLWRFSANHTHLYPGALLRELDASEARSLTPGDEWLVEFSDGVLATGQLLEAATDAVVLRMPPYRTQRGTNVTARTWCIAPTADENVMRVQQRLLA